MRWHGRDADSGPVLPYLTRMRVRSRQRIVAVVAQQREERVRHVITARLHSSQERGKLTGASCRKQLLCEVGCCHVSILIEGRNRTHEPLPA